MKKKTVLSLVICFMLIMAGPVHASGTDIEQFLTGGSGGQSTSLSLNMVSCTDSQTGLTVARASVPQGYQVSCDTTWCGPVQCPGYPAEVFISSMSPDGRIQLTYESAVQFIELLTAEVNGIQFMSHQDGVVHTTTMTLMLKYMNADQYCDFVSENCMEGASGMTLLSATPVTQDMQATLQQISQEYKDTLNQMLVSTPGLSIDNVETTVAEHTYRYTDSYGKSKILVVSCNVQAVDMVESLSDPFMGETKVVTRIWTVPSRYCMIVDEEAYEEGYDIFGSFCTNTRVSDQFVQACQEMSQEITQAIVNASSYSINSQTSYVQDTFTSELGDENDSYTSTEAWDDVIMDRNDYTLSNGDHVKVDTSYDYVYQLEDGNIYATNSASDEPAGGTRLYAN